MLNLYKKWTICLIALVGTIILVTATLNFIFDPLWCFPNINRFTRVSTIIDQRLQKTNLLTFGDNGYDAVIIGSSRSELLNQNEFGAYKTFNYAVPAITCREYLSYLNYFKGKNGKVPKAIFIGLDFFSTSRNIPTKSKDAQLYFSESNERMYRIKKLLGIDTLRILINARFNNEQYFKYDRLDNLLVPGAISTEELQRIFAIRLNMFKQTFYSRSSYRYDESVTTVYAELVRSNPESTLIAFITPESQQLYEYLIKSGRFNDYARWLQDVVTAFGGVYNFMYVNTITRDPSNYVDADHFYPRVGTLIAHKLAGVSDVKIPADFGVYVTRDNLTEHLEFLRRQADSIMQDEGN